MRTLESSPVCPCLPRHGFTIQLSALILHRAPTCVGLLLIVGLVGGVMTMSTPSHAAPSAGLTHSTAAPSVELSILLDSLTPTAANPQAPLTLTGRLRLTDPSSAGPQKVRLNVLTRSSPLLTRESISTLHRAPLPQLSLPHDPATSRIPATLEITQDNQDTAGFTVVIPAHQLPYSIFGVYPLAISAQVGTHSSKLTTTVVWQPNSGSAQPTKLGWLWPLMEEPANLAVDSLEGSTLLTTLDPSSMDYLADQLSASQRLGRLLQALQSGNNADGVTVVSDPALLHAVSNVATTPESTNSGSTHPSASSSGALPSQGSPPTTTVSAPALNADTPVDAESPTPSPAERAAAWLHRLATVAPANQRLLTPYANIDLNALSQAGLHDLVEAAIFQATTQNQPPQTIPLANETPPASQATTNQESPSPQHTDPTLSSTEATPAWVAWPHRGYLAPDALRVLHQGAAQALHNDPSGPRWAGMALSDDALPAPPETTATLDARGTLIQPEIPPTPVLRTDTTLSSLAARPVDNNTPAHTAALTRQEFLSHTAMITAERPSDGRTVIVAPPHQWDPDADLAGQLLALSREVDWLDPIRPAQALRQPSSINWTSLHYPNSQQRQQLPQPYLAQLHQRTQRAQEFTSLLLTPEPLSTRLTQASLLLCSTALRTEDVLSAQTPTGTPITSLHASAQLRDQALEDYTQAVERWRNNVTVQPSSATLGARAGPIPITVVNALDQPVRVRVQLNPSLPRVIVTQTPLITAAARSRRTQVNVPVQAVANGPVDLYAQLQTPTGQDYGNPATVTIRVQTVGPLAMVLTFGAGTLFIVAVITRTARRRWRSSHPKQAGQNP